MSHFAVMVFGDNVEEQLAPYHEFECTGINNEYVIDEDITDEVIDTMNNFEPEEDEDVSALEYALEYHGLSEAEDESEVDIEDEHKYGYAIVKDGKLIKAVNRTNRDSKWDWYQIGGRWSGFLKLKDGSTGEHGERSWTNAGEEIASNYCDSALKRDIDFEGMRNDAGVEAGTSWDEIHAVVGNATWETWASVRDRIDNIDEARDFYNNQSALEELSEAGMHRWVGFDEFLVTREEYVSKARNSAISTFAFVINSEWREKGSMGWWGMSSGDKEQSIWDDELKSIIDSVSDDTRISIIDCHI
jgi:hypothetical protein